MAGRASDTEAQPEHTDSVRNRDAVIPVRSRWHIRDDGRSRSKDAGGGSFYDRVYSADRPELFFKSAPGRVVGTGSAVRIRKDASWSVPEPELTLLINQHGSIIGYTAGNDMSSRDIEGENPLYLPQAKVYNGSCALGPCVLVSSDPLPPSTSIRRNSIAMSRG